jgi:hypothetical protein
VLQRCGWPVDAFADPAKQPREVADAQTFYQELFHGEHLDDIVVLKDGLRKLGQHDAMPTSILSAVEQSATVPEFLGRLDDETRVCTLYLSVCLPETDVPPRIVTTDASVDNVVETPFFALPALPLSLPCRPSVSRSSLSAAPSHRCPSFLCFLCTARCSPLPSRLQQSRGAE